MNKWWLMPLLKSGWWTGWQNPAWRRAPDAKQCRWWMQSLELTFLTKVVKPEFFPNIVGALSVWATLTRFQENKETHLLWRNIYCLCCFFEHFTKKNHSLTASHAQTEKKKAVCSFRHRFIHPTVNQLLVNLFCYLFLFLLKHSWFSHPQDGSKKFLSNTGKNLPDNMT